MKKYLLSLIIAFLTILPLRGLMAAEGQDCPENHCFSTKLIKEQKEGDCTTYTMEIFQDGSCRYALSHFSIEVPCGRITNVSNSGGWAMVVGTTDPTTGITGIKIDDIKNFGESKKPQSFTVTYTVCGASCANEQAGKVAYKASNCVHFDQPQKPYVAMSASLGVKDLKCADSRNGEVNLTIKGGKEPYSFQWSNGATTEDLTGLAAGTYGVTIKDATGAVLIREAVVAAPLPLEVEAEISPAACGGSGTISLSVQGGTVPYTFKWSNGSTASTINAGAGVYEVTITDGNSCSFTKTYSIKESGGFQLSISGGENCGDNALSAVVSGGVAPFSYSWSTGASTANISATASGLYTLTVKDAKGCTSSASKQIAVGEALDLQLTPNNPICAYDNNGSIDLQVEGGSGNYSYSWSNGATSEDLEGLKSGTYSVTVSDAGGCSATASVTLSNPQSIYVRPIEIIQPDCNGGLGSISVEAYYGTAPYTFEWSNGEVASSISELEPGVYRLTVTDANGCSSSRSFTISAPSQPSVSIDGASCSTSLTAVINGGTAPFTYEWSTGETTSTIDITEGGNYEVTVTDANGCSSTASVTAGDPSAAISLAYEVKPPTCNGDSDGSIDLTIEGGDGNYTIIWSNGATTEDLENLKAGTYTVTVSSGSGCSVTETIRVTAPQSIYIRTLEVKNINCLNVGGSISVEAFFGTAPYTFEWDNGATGSSIENLEAGVYTLVVTDANGCSSSRRYTITEESAPLVSLIASGCGKSFQLAANVEGGKSPYKYSWSSGETTESISAGPGSYSLTVVDASGCSSTASIVLEESETSLQLNVEVKDVKCSGGRDGAASLIISGGVAPYVIDWSTGSDSTAVHGLSAGVYSVQVTDASGCSQVQAFTIKEPEAISIASNVVNSVGCGNPTGSIEVEVSGGTAPYKFHWNTNAESSKLQGLSAGNYTLTVEDAKGCVAIRSFIIENEAGGTAPSANLEACADTVICRGATAGIPVYFTGEGPFTLSYAGGGESFTVTTSANPYMLELSPTVATTFVLKGVSNSCGLGAASGQVNIQVSDCSRNQVCEDPCFSTEVLSRVLSGSCETITLKVSTDGNCRYALSHFTVATACGTVSNASNSGGWPMELNTIDPTTGLQGFKVDEIKNFGEGKGAQSFTVTYTVCSNASCPEAASSCGPLVAYKAGSCVYYDKAGESQQLSAPLAGTTAPLVKPDVDLYPNPYQDGQQLNIKLKELEQEGNATVTVRSLTGLQLYKKVFVVGPTNSTITLEMPAVLSSGLYIITIEVQGEYITKQLYVL